jgi:hypothetical protein
MSGLLSRLFARRRPPAPAAHVRDAKPRLYLGHETLEVVGESYRQEALWRIVGGRTSEPVRYETVAELVPDPSNGYDENAIEVRIDGTLVGYLSRQDAVIYRPGLVLLRENSASGRVAFHAVIVGGGPRPDGIGKLGVFIDHDPSDFGLVSHQASVGHLRTGLSEALETHFEDDGYDLAWYRQLPESNVAAVRKLRSLLESERNPFDRHYMLCELEHRLYKARVSFPSALDEFDHVCSQHHAEMVTIRPALLGGFRAIPVIEMYRQSVIRSQKAKLWQAALDWAERGIAVYGSEAARPEVVDDLHKRVSYAKAKIAAQQRPMPRPHAGSNVPTTKSPSGVDMENLVCGACGERFERVRTRGRKPSVCPTCKLRKRGL